MIIRFVDLGNKQQVAEIEADELSVPRCQDGVSIQASLAVMLLGKVESVQWNYDMHTGGVVAYVHLKNFQKVESVMVR